MLDYQPKKYQGKVVNQGEFIFAAIGLEHGHINGMCNGLISAGAELKWVFDRDFEKMKKFKEKFPTVQLASSEEEILQDDEVQLVAAAAIPSERCDLGLRVMDNGKDYFTDKTPFTTLEQLEKARKKTVETGKKYMVYYSERIHVESAVFAGQLIDEGAIGRVIQVTGFGPHRLRVSTRPNWFFEKKYYGGILCDIGSHQIEQFLYYTKAKDAKVMASKVANYHNKAYPELEDFGDATLVGDNGASQYFRVDWLTPDGLGTWGDGRTIILGTKGYIEIRKYIDVARENSKDHLFLVNDDGEKYFHVHGKVGFPFFGDFILDCIRRTENAMTQEHAFKAAELCLLAQHNAIRIE